ncbi:hypothetical protein MTP99_019794 [Tenebrio molitor]|jgi:hypothetical protein|nr:hypothetical protein MTP99_019794 [Tenebrio molitor]
MLDDAEWSGYSASCSEYEPNNESEDSSEVDEPAPSTSSNRTNTTSKGGKTWSSCAAMGLDSQNMNIAGFSNTQSNIVADCQNVVYQVNTNKSSNRS